MNLHLPRALLLLGLLVATPCGGSESRTRCVLLVTIDGLRWEEVFTGADPRLINQADGGVRDVPATEARFGADTEQERRKRLMPFMWEVLARDGQLLGNTAQGNLVRVSNGRFFSYPGYNELLSGFADSAIDSNDKRPNPNSTVLEWLHRQAEFQGRIAAFGSWDVFPFILNAERSGIPVNAGWQPLEVFQNPADLHVWNHLATEVPHYWDNVRYDVFTTRGAIEYLRVKRPRVLYVALGETDDWAHAGRYDLYLDAARRTDDYLRQLWETAQSLDEFRGRTSLLITTDHGRGGGRSGWKNHGTSEAGSELIWIAAMGPDTPARGVRGPGETSQAQVAATLAALLSPELGAQFTAHDPRVAAPLPGVVAGD